MPLPEEVIALRDSGVLSEDDMAKIAEMRANLIESSSEDMGVFLSSIADSLRSVSFSPEDFEKAALLLNEEDGDEYEKLAKVDWVSKMGTLSGAMAGFGKFISKHKSKITPAFLVGMGLALGGGEIVATRAQAKALTSSLGQIKEQYPELKKDKMTDQHFEALSAFSPTVAKNPVVASSLLLKMKQWGSIDHKTIQDLISMERGLRDMGPRGGGVGDLLQSAAAVQQLVAPGEGIFGGGRPAKAQFNIGDQIRIENVESMSVPGA
ncbi:hypothetical protein LCGC14_0516570 [marine sediment metagenome]|uniref:Uncharacterized protein n=1 Tax=marine sediment metagenome TaxID=412755 RepID=A0A0F9S4J0_9ZZZZ